MTNYLEITKNKQRPTSMDYINYIFTDFLELSGDRLYADDKSVIGGIAFLENTPVTVIGQMRGKNIQEQIRYNFSMTSPEGFRKSLRLMHQAEKFKRPIICFIDTIGAYPGVLAEEHGQAAAIANSINEMVFIKVPIISVLIGHGGSGGALALCVADEIAILEYAVFSVISPKAGANILWKDSSKEDEASNLFKMTSLDLYSQGVVDYIIKEPKGGAHTNYIEITGTVKEYVLQAIKKYQKMSSSSLIKARNKKYRYITRLLGGKL